MMTRKQCLDILDLPATASRAVTAKSNRYMALFPRSDRFRTTSNSSGRHFGYKSAPNTVISYRKGCNVFEIKSPE